MARKALVEKEKRREKLVKIGAVKRANLKKIIKAYDTPEEDRIKAMDDLTKMKRDTSKTRLRNRCQISGRSRGYMRKFGLSRQFFREMALAGLIPGITKSSW